MCPLLKAEIYKAFVLLGAKHDLLGTIGSISDSLDDSDVIENLKGWNNSMLEEVRGRIEHYETLSRQ
jgi:hypothetical protein